ncbi:hypothetical protein [Methanobacterium paludis]|uniref:Uncharacterized protein n=1 Tax=Methanobacterium paludis (strain DSM 25820 / JCM 18151 / SWAN1) TaxID=868131 RepID=F6D2V0_METPW|nr:hypothetical protein [Methanobacterium paludis]AEG18679.1 hypothetical protein MSWAN_1668 [Methanobacterium paludis]
MSKISDFSEVRDDILYAEWIDVSREIANIKAIKEKYPERMDLDMKLQSKEGLQELYREELYVRGLLNGNGN